MNKEELFEKIKTLLPLLAEYRRSGSASITPAQIQTLKDVLPAILGNGQYDYSCSTCVLNYMLTLESWYGRECKKMVVEPVQVEPIQVQKNEVKKKGRKKKENG